MALHFTLSEAMMVSSFLYNLGAALPILTSHSENSFASLGGSNSHSGNSYSEFFSTSSSFIPPFPPPASKVIFTIVSLPVGFAGFLRLDLVVFPLAFLTILLPGFDLPASFLPPTFFVYALPAFFSPCFEETAIDGINAVISIANDNVRLNTLDLIFIALPYPFPLINTPYSI